MPGRELELGSIREYRGTLNEAELSSTMPSPAPIHVTQLAATLKIGGSERLAATIGRGLDRDGFLASFAALGEDGPIGEQLRRDGFSATAFGRNEGFDPKLWWRVLRFLRRQRSEVVQTHHVGSLIYGGPPTRFAGAKLIHTEHEINSFRAHPGHLGWLRRLAPLVHRFVAIDPLIGRFLESEAGIDPNRIQVIRNGIDLETFHPRRNEDRWDSSAQFVVGWVARLDPPKRPDVLLDAFIPIARADRRLRLKIVGPGSLLDEARRRVADAGITDQVEILGARADIAEQLRTMDCYVLVSDSEGLPISLVEAMASGLPTIASAVGGIGNLVKDGSNGILLSPNEPLALRAALERLRDQRDWGRRLGAEARKTAQEQFDGRKTIEEYATLFREVTCRATSLESATRGVRRAAKRAVYRGLSALGADHWSRRRHAADLVIVMYHGLATEASRSAPSWLLLPTDSFEQQLLYLKRNYTVISMADAARRFERGEAFSRPTAVITLDDGYKNNLVLGWPILKRLGLPATIYLTTGFIGTKRVLWTILLEQALLTTRVARLDLTDIGLKCYAIGGQSDAEVDRARFELKQNLYRLKRKEREAVLEVVFDRLGYDARAHLAEFEPLDWSDLRSMAADSLIDFGAHTVHHEVVSALDEAELEEEIGGSMRAIERELGRPAVTFAYPNGRAEDFDARAQRVAARAGALAALSTIEGLNPPGTDRFALRRVSVDSEMSLARFRLLTSGLIPDIRRWMGRASDGSA